MGQACFKGSLGAINLFFENVEKDDLKGLFELKDMNGDRPIDLLCMKGYNVQHKRDYEGKECSIRYPILLKILAGTSS